MPWPSSVRYSIWWNRLIHWEFWPAPLINAPVLVFWLWYGLKAGDLFFFSNTNPSIETGGVVGESKSNIFNHLPAWCLPVMTLVDLENDDPEHIVNRLDSHGLSYPCIVKPDIGERGYLVERIQHEQELLLYFSQVPTGKYIIQEYVDWPLELSVMYHRYPDQQQGAITSICIKEPLQVLGDGVSSLGELIEKYPRARIQWPRIQSQFDATIILPTGKALLLDPIGNHCRGATFLNGNQHITPALIAVFDKISQESIGMFYGRFDLKCQSLESLTAGKKFSILEYNGVAAEPAHIYHPGRSLIKAYQDLFEHWRIIYRVHKRAKALGYQTMNWKDAFRAIKSFWQRPEAKVELNAT